MLYQDKFKKIIKDHRGESSETQVGEGDEGEDAVVECQEDVDGDDAFITSQSTCNTL